MKNLCSIKHSGGAIERLVIFDHRQILPLFDRILSLVCRNFCERNRIKIPEPAKMGPYQKMNPEPFIAKKENKVSPNPKNISVYPSKP